jgi:hypothetical protein
MNKSSPKRSPISPTNPPIIRYLQNLGALKLFYMIQVLKSIIKLPTPEKKIVDTRVSGTNKGSMYNNIPPTSNDIDIREAVNVFN